MRGIKFFGIVFVLLGLVLWSGCANTPSNSPESSSERIASASTLPSAWSSVTPSENASQPSPSSIGVQMPNESKVREADGLYGYDETGRMISFTLESENRRTNIPPSECLSEEELRRLGEEYLKDKVPLNQYVFSGVQDYSSRQQMEFDYEKTIAGYRCFDFVYVTVAYDGTITHFFAPRVGIFDNVTVPKIDRSKLLEQLDIMVKERWGDIPYEVKDSWYLTILEDGTIAMQLDVIPNGEEIYTDDFNVPIESK